MYRLAIGSEDPRLRATWRLVLAWPLLPLVGALTAAVMPVLGLRGLVPGGPIQGVIFLGILVGWAGIVDRRPLAGYGVSLSSAWAARLLIGFAAVVAVWSAWHGVAALAGWMRIEWAGTGWATLVGALVSLAVNTWVQDVVFFAIVLVAAAEGLRSRGADPRRAVVGGWLVAAAFFTAIHGTPTALDFLGTLAGGLVFGLLYVHTGDLALTIGVHWGSSYAAGFVFPRAAPGGHGAALFRVVELGALAKGMAVPMVLYPATYLLLVAGLWLADADLGPATALAEGAESARGVGWPLFAQ